ncbi:MAG: CBS domain-containing protein [Nitrospirota bacterium]|jgi:signal-transduction protein with cAMP-binding, CBS, and nucleotidyltransferase domain
MTIMINKNIRHLPVVEQGKIVSVLSIRDMVKSHVSNLQAEVHYLKVRQFNNEVQHLGEPTRHGLRRLKYKP